MERPEFARRVEEWREEARDMIGEGLWLRALAAAVVLYLIAAIGLGMYWSGSPPLFSVGDAAARATASQGAPTKQGIGMQPGATSAATLMEVTATLLDKPGGLLSNDLLPPGAWLDNMPAWERGALGQAHDFARALREAFSRANSEAAEDLDLGKVEPRLNFAIDSWVLPSSESQYREAIEYLQSYLARLGAAEGERAQFHPRPDTLNHWLGLVAARLSNLSQRLSACVPPPDTALEQAVAPVVQTPWGEIDDVFYEARGSAWALIHLLRAVEIDFAAALQQKNAQLPLRQIILELESTQEPIYSPMILNGDGFGMLANHSLVMASYVARANAEIVTLRERLAQP